MTAILRATFHLASFMAKRRASHKSLPDAMSPGHQPQKLECPSALYEADQLQRVLRCGFGTTLPEEVTKLNQREFLETPLEEFQLGPTLVLGGRVLSSRGEFPLSLRRFSLKGLPVVEEFNEPTILVNSMQGLRYFGHWLRDDCSAYEAYRSTGALVSLSLPEWRNIPYYTTAFQQTWRVSDNFFTPDLTVVRDLGFSLAKKRRIEELRLRLRSTFRKSGDEVVFLARGSSGAQRDAANQSELIRRLVDRGVSIVSAESEIDKLLDAKLIITTEGSQAAHAVYHLADRGSLLILQPPYRFYNPHLEWARLLGMQYGIVVGEDRGQANYVIHPEEVLRMIDRLL